MSDVPIQIVAAAFNSPDGATKALQVLKDAKAAGAREEQLVPALELHRKAQWRLDFIAAENSMGFHAPQEAARVLAEAIDYARQGQVVALKLKAAK